MDLRDDKASDSAGEDPPTDSGEQAGRGILDRVLNVGVDGLGPFKGAAVVADEALASCRGDVERAVDQIIKTHVRLAGTNGFVTGLGGIAALPVTLPVGVGGYYLLGARLAAAVAHLRGEDLHSDHVRSAVLVTMLGSAGTEVLKEAGVQIGTKSLAAALKRVPGKVFIEINKRVGFRLVTKGGTKGVLNVGKLVPIAGAPIGAAIDATSMKAVGRYARKNFAAHAEAH